MRYFMLFIFALLLFACDNITQPTYKYDQMLFERVGGGNLEFTVSRGTSSTIFQVSVSRISYQDTSISIVLTRNVDNASAFDSLSKTLDGQFDITGTFKRDSLIVGTWTFVYMVKDTVNSEVTNVDLRNTLLKFEGYVNQSL